MANIHDNECDFDLNDEEKVVSIVDPEQHQEENEKEKQENQEKQEHLKEILPTDIPNIEQHDVDFAEPQDKYYSWRMHKRAHIDFVGAILILVIGTFLFSNRSRLSDAGNVTLTISQILIVLLCAALRFRFQSLIPLMILYMIFTVQVNTRFLHKPNIESYAPMLSILTGCRWWYILICESTILVSLQIVKHRIWKVPLPDTYAIIYACLQVFAGIITALVIDITYKRHYQMEIRLKSTVMQQQQISQTLSDACEMIWQNYKNVHHEEQKLQKQITTRKELGRAVRDRFVSSIRTSFKKQFSAQQIAKSEKYRMHEIRNIMQFIIANISQGGNVSVLSDHCQRLIDIMTDGLNRDQWRSYKSVHDASMKHIIKSWLEGVQYLAIENKVNVTASNDLRLLSGKVDRHVEHILCNISTNAIKYGHKNVWISGSKHDKFCEISIKDDGPGISPKIIHSINMEWNQKDCLQEGSGIGLHLINLITQGIGGKLEFKVDRGTEVIIMIPYEDCDVEDENEIEETMLLNNNVKHDVKVLVVDDEKEMGCLAAERLLHVEEFEFETNPSDVFARDDLNTFDAIFIDHEFGKNVMDGIEVTRRLRYITTPNVVLVGQTANAETEYNNYISAGATDVLAKPFNPKKVETIMNTIKKRKEWWRSSEFRDVLPDMLKRMAEQLNTDDSMGLAHKIVGTAGPLGISDLYDAARMLDKSEKEQGFVTPGGNKSLLCILGKYTSV